MRLERNRHVLAFTDAQRQLARSVLGAVIDRHPQPVAMADLAAAAGGPPPIVAAIVDVLACDGLLRRIADRVTASPAAVRFHQLTR